MILCLRNLFLRVSGYLLSLGGVLVGALAIPLIIILAGLFFGGIWLLVKSE
jgi:hypothetical protein